MRVAVTLLIPVIAGCSQHQIYEQIRQNRLDACAQHPEAAAKACRRDFSMAFEEYREVLRDLDGED